MHESLAKLVDLVKVIIAFTLLTLFFYVVIVWVAGYIHQHGPEQEPAGKSIQVMEQEANFSISSMNDFTKRLTFFYWFGE